MAFLDEIMEPVGKAMVFESLRPGLRGYFAKAGYEEVPYILFGRFFYLILAVFLAIYIPFVIPLFSESSFISGFIYYFLSATGILVLLAVNVILIIHFILNIQIYNRTKELERILPDYLTLVSTNLKGGMSFEQALWSAIKPEFGVLANEIGLVSKKVMTGNEVPEALNEFIRKYDSPILRRNFQLIVSEFDSGGRIVVVIDRIIINLKKTTLLKKEMTASTVTYMMFIAVLVVVVCPGLFALSYQLFFIIQGFIETLTQSTTSGNLSIATATVNPTHFRIFSASAIGVIAVGSSFITSIIEKGDLSGAVKYAPMYLIISLVVYFISAWGLGLLFSGISI